MNQSMMYPAMTPYFITPPPPPVNLCFFPRSQLYGNEEKDPAYGPAPSAPEPLPDTVEEIMQQQSAEVAGVKGHWDIRLTSFQKLLFVKAFREEKV